MLSRVKICNCSVHDFDDYYKLKCSYSDMYWNGFTQEPDREMLFKIFEERIKYENKPYVEAKRIKGIYIEEHLIGYVQSTFCKNEIEIGISILDLYQDKGLGSEVLSVIAKEYKEYEQIVFARIRDDNPRSRRVFEKNGFKAMPEYEEIYYPNVNSNIKLRRYELVK